MKSDVAKQAERELVQATQRLTPEERVNAFLTHSRLMAELFEAGKKQRDHANALQSVNQLLKD
jgi:vacuolar-type H+-ATPase subunit B/Vma2